MERYRQRYVAGLARYAGQAESVLRVGLGVVLVLAGAHKLVAPAAWTRYAPEWVVAVWPESVLGLEPFMVLNGVIEVGFGLAIAANVYPAVLAGVTALSLFGVAGMLATGALAGGGYVDVLIRDFGLGVLAAGVALLVAGGEVEGG